MKNLKKIFLSVFLLGFFVSSQVAYGMEAGRIPEDRVTADDRDRAGTTMVVMTDQQFAQLLNGRANISRTRNEPGSRVHGSRFSFISIRGLKNPLNLGRLAGVVFFALSGMNIGAYRSVGPNPEFYKHFLSYLKNGVICFVATESYEALKDFFNKVIYKKQKSIGSWIKNAAVIVGGSALVHNILYRLTH